MYSLRFCEKIEVDYTMKFLIYLLADLGQEKEGPVEDSKTIQFAVLMRKGPKQTLKEVAVPKDSDMAQNLLKQEEAQRLEKERMKKLTLEINERQEEEEVNEAIAMVRLIFIRLGVFLQIKRISDYQFVRQIITDTLSFSENVDFT